MQPGEPEGAPQKRDPLAGSRWERAVRRATWPNGLSALCIDVWVWCRWSNGRQLRARGGPSTGFHTLWIENRTLGMFDERYPNQQTFALQQGNG
jgi:hypothetical protein